MPCINAGILVMLMVFPSLALALLDSGDNCKVQSRLRICKEGLTCYANIGGAMMCRKPKEIGKGCISSNHCASGKCVGSPKVCAVTSESFDARCDSVNDCGWENRCDMLGSKTCQRRFARGEECIIRYQECEPGLRCLSVQDPSFWSSEIELNGVCRSPLGLGAICERDHQCSDTAMCTGGICAGRIEEGEECLVEEQKRAFTNGTSVPAGWFRTNCSGGLKCELENDSKSFGICTSATTTPPTTVSTAPSTTRPAPTPKPSPLNAEAIIGLAVGIPGLILSLVAIYFAYKSNRRNRTEENQPQSA